MNLFMRPFTSTISFDEARRRLDAAVRPIARTERVPLASAGWRVAAEHVVRCGDMLNPGRIGAIGAIGRKDLDVFAKPRVAVLSTGNEVVEPGTTLAPGQIYDVNRFTLTSIVEAHGGIADPRPPADDTI